MRTMHCIGNNEGHKVIWKFQMAFLKCTFIPANAGGFGNIINPNHVHHLPEVWFRLEGFESPGQLKTVTQGRYRISQVPHLP